jgi:hypothetical protein
VIPEVFDGTFLSSISGFNSKENDMTTATIENQNHNQLAPSAIICHPQFGARKKIKQRTKRQERRLVYAAAHPGEWDNQRVFAIHRLRINAKSLAAESRLIRQEEKRCGLIYVELLRSHRIRELREESRYAGLALAFIRGRKYSEVENKGSRPVDAARLEKKIDKFLHYRPGSPDFHNWLTGEKYWVIG